MSWPGGKQFAIFVNVAYERWSKAPGVSPMGNPLPVGYVDTQARSWGNYGPRGMERLLGILEDKHVQATVMASGSFAESTPSLLADIASQRHEICGHGMYQDVLPVTMGRGEELESIKACTGAIETASGQRPVGWISPRGTPSDDTAALLAAEGYEWFGDCFDADSGEVRSTDGGPIVFLPLTMEVNDLPLAMKHGGSPSDYVSSVEDALTGFSRYADGTTHLDVTVHAHVSGRPAFARAFEDALELVLARDDVWMGTRAAAARQIHESEPDQVGA